MATYLIDYENVQHHGFQGAETLSEKDQIVVFLGKTTGELSKDAMHPLFSSKAQIVLNKMKRVGKNYLDFQLATSLGFYIGSSDEKTFYIISKDADFKKVLDFVNPARPNVTIKQQTAIKEMTPKIVTVVATETKITEPPNAIRNKIKPIITGQISLKHISGAAHRKTYEIFKDAKKAKKDKEHSFKDRLKHEFGDDVGTFLSEQLIGIFKEYLTDK
jgi:hypothetical protein